MLKRENNHNWDIKMNSSDKDHHCHPIVFKLFASRAYCSIEIWFHFSIIIILLLTLHNIYFELIGINYTKAKPLKTNINLRKLRLSHLICTVWKESFWMAIKTTFRTLVIQSFHVIIIISYGCCFLIHICWRFIWFACLAFNL